MISLRPPVQSTFQTTKSERGGRVDVLRGSGDLLGFLPEQTNLYVLFKPWSMEGVRLMAI